MSISKILNEKDLSAEEKLTKVSKSVAAAREAYGNTDVEITVPEVSTAHGMLSFDSLLDDAKVNILSNEVCKLRVQAVEFGKSTEGANVNKRVEELISTNGFFCNIKAKTEINYL